jgi:hypothetical protein
MTTACVKGALKYGAPALAWIVLLVVAVVLVPATGSAAPVDSGIAGVVRGADCTFTRDGRSCSGRRSPTTIEIYRDVGAPTVATARVGPLGTFRVHLVPGRYLLRVTFPRSAPAADLVVLVRPHRFTFVVVQRASRIR